MTCAVDPVAWGEKNRVELAMGKTQEWVLARTTRDAPTLTSVPQTARAVMTKWFAGTPLDVMFADAGDAVDAVTVTAVTDAPPPPSSADQRREALDPVPLLAAGATPPLYVSVSFNYRGYAKSMPWPVWTAASSLLKTDKLCPFECDWMLVSARDLTKLRDVPSEASWLTKLEDASPGPLGDLATLTKLAGWGVLAYVGFQAFGWLRLISPPKRSSQRARRAA